MKTKRIIGICSIAFIILLLATCVKAIAIDLTKYDQEEAEESASVKQLQASMINNSYDTFDSVIMSMEPLTSASYTLTKKDVVILEENKSIEVTKENIEYEDAESDSPDQYNNYTENDIYLWAKIVMCEAEGESQLCKEYIAQVIKNRVDSNEFPDTIYDVIFQKNQFTPTFNGRWERVEPNQDCYDAVYTVINSDTQLIDALYFECCDGDSWHSRNLTKVAEEDGTRFYK